VTTDGVTVVRFRAIDGAGNTSAWSKVTARLDSSAPTDPTVTGASPGWVNSASVVVTAAGSSDLWSGLGSYQSQTSTDGGVLWSPLVSGSHVTVAGEGSTIVRFRASDNVGNTSSWVPVTVNIDRTKPSAPVTVTIPYTPTPDELQSPESIIIWYIDGSGNAVMIPNGHYDASTGCVTFETTHFSQFAVGYSTVTYGDIPAGAWYGKAVSFLAARDITTGTGDDNFSPSEKLTRGQAIVILMNAYSISPEENLKDNFTDAGNTWYTKYLATARRLGLSAGVGNNLFAPEKEITRQEMFTMLQYAENH
jgi:hypothetical protein